MSLYKFQQPLLCSDSNKSVTKTMGIQNLIMINNKINLFNLVSRIKLNSIVIYIILRSYFKLLKIKIN